MARSRHAGRWQEKRRTNAKNRLRVSGFLVLRAGAG
jgi:hypothetical protein